MRVGYSSLLLLSTKFVSQEKKELIPIEVPSGGVEVDTHEETGFDSWHEVSGIHNKWCCCWVVMDYLLWWMIPADFLGSSKQRLRTLVVIDDRDDG